MSDGLLASVALIVAASHVAIFVVAWAWAARSRQIWFLFILVPAAVAWALAGYPLVKVLTYGTRSFSSPRGGLQSAGFASVLLGFVGFFVCTVGALVTIVLRATGGEGAGSGGKA